MPAHGRLLYHLPRDAHEDLFNPRRRASGGDVLDLFSSAFENRRHRMSYWRGGRVGGRFHLLLEENCYDSPRAHCCRGAFLGAQRLSFGLFVLSLLALLVQKYKY